MLTEGTKFGGRYVLEKLLGRGGFSEVWLAKDDYTGVQAALKVYAPGMGLDEDGVKMFTQEFSLVYDMNHTNLLRPTYFDSWERQPYLILPYCKNGSTFKYITEHRKMAEEDCWHMIHDVAAGLAYLHEKTPPLVHQDIKPDNILISDEGIYMITDFGISTRVRSTIRNGQSQEQSGGTMAYMGPECFSAKPKPIMAGDIWSMGAMMYELMTGEPPFGNHGGVMQKNGADIPLIEGDYSDDLKNLIYRMLEKETWDRPSARNIEEFAYSKLHGMPLKWDLIIPKPENTAAAQQQAGAQRQQGPRATVMNRNSFRKSVSYDNQSVPFDNQSVPYGTQQAPYGNQSVPYGTQQAPYGNQSVPYGTQQNPYGQSMPYGAQPGFNSGVTPKPKSKLPMIIGGAITALIIIIGGVWLSLGGGDGKTADKEMVEKSQQFLDEANKIMMEADVFMSTHVGSEYDAENGKIEDKYLEAIRLYEQVEGDLSADAGIGKTKARGKLETIYNGLLKKADELKDFEEYWRPLKERADVIKPELDKQ